MVSATLYLAVAVIALVYCYFRNFYRKLKPGEPPIAAGHWLWGNGEQFAKHAVKFLQGAQKTCGDVFTVRFLNQHWTMMLDVHAYETFASEKNFDFDAIQEQVNMNVFGFKLQEARKMIGRAGQKVNGKHLYSSLENFANNLKQCLKETVQSYSNIKNPDKSSANNNNNNNNSEHPAKTNSVADLNEKNSLYDRIDDADRKINIQNDSIHNLINSERFQEKTQSKSFPSLPVDNDWHEDNLRDLASKAFFSPVFYTIFGRPQDNQPEGNFQPQIFHKNFDKFHEYFNFLWLGLPIRLFRKAGEAVGILAQQPESKDMVKRKDVSEYIKLSTTFMKERNQTEQEIISHNLVFLHVNYNTFRTVYWCLYKLMEDAASMEAVRREVEQATDAKRQAGEDDAEFTAEDINNLPIVDSFLKEVLRWTSGVFMVRKCVADTAFTTSSGQTYNIRAGDKVAIYPPVLHFDPEIYQNPNEFQYNRFNGAEFFKNGRKIDHPLIAFGSRCPGQKLANLQIKWFLVNFVNSFKFELREGESTRPNEKMYGHEILPPTNDVRVRFAEKQSATELKFLNSYSQGNGNVLHGISSGNLL